MVYDTGALLSKELKHLFNYRKGGNRGFDTVMPWLQMQSYVTIGDFVDPQDKFGQTYGWGVAQFGYDFVTPAYRKDTAKSKADILTHLKNILPDAGETQLLKLMK